MPGAWTVGRRPVDTGRVDDPDEPRLHPVDGTPLPAPIITAAHWAKAEKAWAARCAGGTWAQAALTAGYSDGDAACKAVKSCYGSLPKPLRDDLRDLWRDRLERAWRQVCVDMAEQR